MLLGRGARSDARARARTAKKLVFEAGVEIVWVAAPPSDQAWKTQVVPFRTWGDGASRVRTIPATPVKMKGAVTGVPSSPRVRPAWLASRVTSAFRGRTSRVTSLVRPNESCTRRWMRYQTFALVSPLVGMVKEPLFAPVVSGTKGWKWVSWWKSTRQMKADAGSVPSSKSLAFPA